MTEERARALQSVSIGLGLLTLGYTYLWLTGGV